MINVRELLQKEQHIQFQAMKMHGLKKHYILMSLIYGWLLPADFFIPIGCNQN